ncbi:putative ABC transport system permease protein [Hymenobacter daecheongensis DSM 21074]|uniref:Putative ABC transport system permease protein n=1 Tax=Hymenobacter daecheongensis DSM 21074 TaxID=1121955 RepID=A0A1M6L7D5_9BACT|nr:FtsX-like permease family protein [Hymenobacter daecheongensis]SHJ67116.1 putative ABC transport system permease protein [Hymenobacter daecheongensis DSM 21074]
MLRHIFRLIWNRKRANLLLLSEILFSFIVLFGVGTLLFTFGQNYLLPRGFAHQNVWRLNISAAQGEKMPRPVLDDVLRQVRALPGVLDISLGSPNTPFRFLTMNSEFRHGNRKSDITDRYDADDRYLTTLGLTLREGRWFQARDDANPRRPAVITQNLREALFAPGEPVLGQLIQPADQGFQATGQEEYQVVGVVENVRPGSDFSGPQSGMWLRLVPYDTTHWEGAAVLVKVAPGQGPALQQRIVRTIAGVTRQWSTEVRTLEADRLDKLRVTLAPLAALAVVGIFLIVNVALGLFGVLWYNISQRRAEIGLRRAMGATGRGIGHQFLLETMVLTTLAVAAGLLLTVQFPLLGAFGGPPRVYGMAMLLATGVVFLITAVCAWQPSRLAARIQPAAALREE